MMSHKVLKPTVTLDPENKKLQKVYQTITKSKNFNPKHKVNKELFTEYLLMKYPKIFVDTMILYFDFPDTH